MQKEVFEETIPLLKEMIEGQVKELATVGVYQKFANLYEVEVKE